MSRALDLLTDACAQLPTNVRKMFGGHGFFAPNGGMFAGIVTDDEVIFKLVAGPLRDELISLGGREWVYEGRDRPMTMHEWIVVPERFYDDPELFAQWAAKAHGAVPAKTAKSAGKTQPGSKPKKKSEPAKAKPNTGKKKPKRNERSRR